MYIKRKTNYLSILLGQEKNVFRTADLAVLWEVENPSSLRVMIKRYMDRGILYPVQRGLYSVKPLDKLDGFELGRAVAGPFAYISGETVLAREGVIMQQVNKITLFGLKRLEFQVAGRSYLCRYLNPKYLLNRAGIEEKQTHSIASLERAVADILQINPNYYFDNQKRIDEKEVQKLKSKVGYI